ncbi:hypothetical protein P8452_25410 [Trifolium repens]|nr:hypothetical protein P8452_25410 [Trifolium repens]
MPTGVTDLVVVVKDPVFRFGGDEDAHGTASCQWFCLCGSESFPAQTTFYRLLRRDFHFIIVDFVVFRRVRYFSVDLEVLCLGVAVVSLFARVAVVAGDPTVAVVAGGFGVVVVIFGGLAVIGFFCLPIFGSGEELRWCWRCSDLASPGSGW